MNQFVFQSAMQGIPVGTQAGFQRFQPAFGRWIRLDRARWPELGRSPASCFADASACRFAVAVFRRDFELAETPVAVRAKHTGDVRYRISVNGEFVVTGPVEAGGDYGKTDSPDWRFVAVSDWSGRFAAGRNAIVAEVTTLPLAQTDYSGGEAGFFCEVEFVFADGRVERLGTEAGAWKGTVAGRFTAPDCCVAAADGLGDYRAVDCDGVAAWPAATELPADHLARETWYESGIAELFTASVQARPEEGMLPLVVPFGRPRRLRFDFPTEITGCFECTVRGRCAMRLTIEYAEYPDVVHGREVYVLRDGVQSFRSLRMNAMRTVFLTVETGTFDSTGCEGLEILALGAEFVSYPVVNRGEIASCDPRLDEMVRCCRWTLQLCRQRLHLDSPVHQEGLGCTGDYMIESMFNYYTSGDASLTALDIRRTALLLRQQEGKMFHTLFALLWIRMALDHYQYTGDAALLAEVRGEIDLELDLFATYVGPEGLVSAAPNYMFVDWVWQGEFNLHHPPAQIGIGPASAFYYGALLDGARAAEVVGDAARSEELRRRAAALLAAFHRCLWVPERGLFRDGLAGISPVEPSGWLPADDPALESYSKHTNVLAAAVGLVEGEEAQALLRRTLNDDSLLDMQPYFHYYCFEALRRNRLFAELGLPRFGRWYALVAEHPESLKECWNAGDYSHAWGCAPAVAAYRAIAGVTPETPGWGKARIAPEWGSFERFSCRVPTPHGMIELEKNAAGCRVQLPDGVAAVLELDGEVREVPPGGALTF